MNRYKITLAFIIIALIIGWSCNPNNQPGYYITLTGPTQGTSYHITYQSNDSIDFQNEIDSLLRQFDLSLSTYEPASIISRINRDEPDVSLTGAALIEQVDAVCFTGSVATGRKVGEACARRCG